MSSEHPTIPDAPALAMSVEQFCKTHNISIGFFYTLRPGAARHAGRTSRPDLCGRGRGLAGGADRGQQRVRRSSQRGLNASPPRRARPAPDRGHQQWRSPSPAPSPQKGGAGLKIEEFNNVL